MHEMTHLKRHILIETSQRSVAQNLGTPIILTRLVDDITVLKFDKTVLVLLIAQGDKFVEHELIAAHFCCVVKCAD